MYDVRLQNRIHMNNTILNYYCHRCDALHWRLWVVSCYFLMFDTKITLQGMCRPSYVSTFQFILHIFFQKETKSKLFLAKIVISSCFCLKFCEQWGQIGAYIIFGFIWKFWHRKYSSCKGQILKVHCTFFHRIWLGANFGIKMLICFWYMNWYVIHTQWKWNMRSTHLLHLSWSVFDIARTTTEGNENWHNLS